MEMEKEKRIENTTEQEFVTYHAGDPAVKKDIPSTGGEGTFSFADALKEAMSNEQQK